jgi:hypothetical protein
MNIRFFIFILSVLLFTSCSEEKRQQFREKMKPSRPFLFTMELMFSDAEQQISFPIWFDDDLVREKKVKTITRSIFPLNASTDDRTPKKIVVYQFNERGSLESLRFQKFYENTIVENITFNYLEGKDKMGYADVEIADSENQEYDGDEYLTYNKEKYLERFLVYTDDDSGDYIFFMLNEKNWGALSIDSILKPTPNDLIVLGSPSKPFKKYKVHNTVSETNVVDYEYRGKDEVIKSISFENYPFYYKRYVNYDKKGYCTGFIDSTFTANEYLTRTVSTFQMNKKALPKKLIQTKPGGGGYELFEYEYY